MSLNLAPFASAFLTPPHPHPPVQVLSPEAKWWVFGYCLACPLKEIKGQPNTWAALSLFMSSDFQITAIQLQSAPELRQPVLCVPLSPQSMDERLKFSMRDTHAWERGSWDLEGSLAGLQRLWPLGWEKLPTCCVSHCSALKKVKHVFSSHVLVSYKSGQNIS